MNKLPWHCNKLRKSIGNKICFNRPKLFHTIFISALHTSYCLNYKLSENIWFAMSLGCSQFINIDMKKDGFNKCYDFQFFVYKGHWSKYAKPEIDHQWQILQYLLNSRGKMCKILRICSLHHFRWHAKFILFIDLLEGLQKLQ